MCGRWVLGMVKMMVDGWVWVMLSRLLVLFGVMLLFRLVCFRFVCLVMGVVIWV